MRFYKNKPGVVAAVAVAMLLAAGWLAFKPSPKTTTTSTPGTSQSTQAAKGADSTQTVTIETADFKYAKPVGWVEISSKTLGSTGAASGIGRPTEPVATFSIKVSNATPKDSNELKNSALDDIKKNAPNFALLSSVSTKVDGQTGQKFTYNFSDSSGNNKTTQQMSVLPYKQKTFFLLFSSAAADYNKQTGDFTSILNTFKFK
jgi:hypothetical protein